MTSIPGDSNQWYKVAELTAAMYVVNDVVPLILPSQVSWALRFNGRGFDTVPGSCVLGYSGSSSFQ